MLYDLFSLDISVALCRDNRSGYHHRLDGQSSARQDDGMDIGLLLHPFVGIIFYFFFGQNTRKERLISDRSMDQLTKRSMLEFVEQENLHLPDSNKPLMNLFANQSWALPFKDNQVDIYTDGYDFFLTLLYNIGQAKHHIHLDTYIFEADALGYLIADA